MKLYTPSSFKDSTKSAVVLVQWNGTHLVFHRLHKVCVSHPIFHGLHKVCLSPHLSWTPQGLLLCWYNGTALTLTPQGLLLRWYNGMALTLSFTDFTRSVSLTPSFMDSTRSVFHTIFHGLRKVCCCAGTMERHSP